MKILITGSNGLLGQKLTDYYKTQSNIELIATARGEDRYADKIGYTYQSLDITNEIEVESIVAKYKPDVIINTAAMTNVDACESDQAGCDALNVNAVQYLVNAANNIHAHLIQVSTDFIFDGTHGPLKEDEQPNPLSYYGHSKFKGEQIVVSQCKSWTILRTVLVYGVVSDMSRSNIVLWAKTNLEQGKTLNVVGDQFRTPTLAEDLAQGCVLAAAQKAQGIFNISGKDFVSVFKQPAKRPPITGFIIDKAVNELGYKPHSFEEGLALLDKQLKAM
jgi:dTDP-4-dehydrorhamnose reductase